MSTTLKYIHIGIAEGNEIGVHFERKDDVTLVTATGRAFVTVDAALLAPVVAAAEAALTTEVEALAALPPGAVTTALMQKRNALQEATKAEGRKRQADEARTSAEAAASKAAQECEAAMAEKERLAAELVALDAEIAAKRAEAAKV